jgi:hypothetical protein
MAAVAKSAPIQGMESSPLPAAGSFDSILETSDANYTSMSLRAYGAFAEGYY